jgi:hypothetical protein
MELLLFLIWGLIGLVAWCGTPPRPEPAPNPFRPVGLALAFVGGLVGGALFNYTVPVRGELARVDVAFTLVGAFVGGCIATYLLVGRQARR